MKQNIDDYFTKNYLKLVRIAQKKINYFHRPVEAEVLVNHAYVHCLTAPINKIDDIGRFAVNNMNTELKYYNSKTLREERLNDNPELVGGIVDECRIYKYMDNLDEQAELNKFRDTLTREEQIVWDAYINGHGTVTKIAVKFNIYRTQAYKYIKQIETKINKHYGSKEGISKHDGRVSSKRSKKKTTNRPSTQGGNRQTEIE